eukprot:CAMPEP_0170479842 /NCGR_PEP_ID=MMETSP0208-20121228/915_1 /TAXON_ID=197538 /ORGANISM="Strombidium inclinatum, Strain S3" /LENGTH=168 /DNA_ID=CAMNT_0010752301 /DNA_START=3246 /DNA_END=3752 /DNA_ORIENTATION=-
MKKSSLLNKEDDDGKDQDPSPLLLKTTVGGEAEIDVGIISPMSPNPVKELNPLAKSPRSPKAPEPIQSKSPLILTETHAATAEKKGERSSPKSDNLAKSKPATSSSKRVTSESQKADKSQKGDKHSDRGEKPGEKKKEKQKMIITGDDILIEYVSRLVVLLNSILSLY